MSNVDEIRETIAALRQSWGWLGELVEPGYEERPMRIMSDGERARRDQAARAERAERRRKATGLGPLTERLSEIGAGALAPSKPAVRIGIVDTAIAVRDLVLSAASAAATAMSASFVILYLGDAVVTDALAYLDGGPSCWIASTTGVVGYRPAFGALDHLPAHTLGTVDRLLAKADRLARAAAGITGEETHPFPLPCPACGRRALQWVMPRADYRSWSIQCSREACQCTGEGCPCRQAIRYPGRRHTWAYGELDGTWGLRRAIAAAERQNTIRSGAQGHGGWPERK